jgi:hypothetical protein
MERENLGNLFLSMCLYLWRSWCNYIACALCENRLAEEYEQTGCAALKTTIWL